MYRTSLTLIAILGALAGGLATAGDDPGRSLDAACTRPAWTGALPDPSSASREQMLEAQAAVREFDAAVAEYSACLESGARAATAAAGPEAADGIAAARASRNDAAVADAERVASDFNERLRAWRNSGRHGGAEVVPPRLAGTASQEAVNRCYPWQSRRENEDARINVTVIIEPDGSVREVRTPDGTPDHLARAARCVGEQLRFTPATVGGKSVVSEATVPIDLSVAREGRRNAPVLSPTLAATEPEIVAAHAACWPDGFDRRGEPLVEITVDVTGTVTWSRIARSSGDGTVDDIGRCIIHSLRFNPATRDGAPVESRVNWPVRVYPPY